MKNGNSAVGHFTVRYVIIPQYLATAISKRGSQGLTHRPDKRRDLRTHIRWCTPSEEICARRCKDINNLRVLGEKTFMLDVAGNHCNIARYHRSLIAPNSKIHPALKHPNNLLVRMLMRSSTCAGLKFPPNDHSLIPRNDAPLNFVVDTLPRQSRKRAEARHHWHENCLLFELKV